MSNNTTMSAAEIEISEKRTSMVVISLDDPAPIENTLIPPRAPTPAYIPTVPDNYYAYTKEMYYMTPPVDMEAQNQPESSFSRKFRQSSEVRMIFILLLSFIIVGGIVAGVIAFLAMR